MTDPIVTSINSVTSAAAAEVTKAERWLQKYLTQWLIGAAIAVAATRNGPLSLSTLCIQIFGA